jgi:hypothetical protein
MSQACSKYAKFLATFWAEIALVIGIVLAALIMVLIFAGTALIAGMVVVIIVFFILIFVLMIFAALAFPIAIQEDRYGFSWVPRALILFKNKIGKTIALVLLTGFLILVLQLILQTLFALFPPLVSTVGNVLVTALLQPVALIAYALLYLDIRITTEGYDLEILLAAMHNKEENNANDE